MERKHKRMILHDIIGKIEKFRAKNKIDVRKAVHKQLMQNFREEEYIRMLHIMKGSDYAKAVELKKLFLYLFKDEIDQIELANDVTREYQAGKFDPEQVKVHQNKKTKITKQPKTKSVTIVEL